MNYMHVVWLGSTNIPKTIQAISKTKVLDEWHKWSSPKIWALSGCCSTQNLKIPWVCHFTHSCKWLSSMGIPGIQSSHVYWRMYTLKCKTVIMETIKHDILIVSKSVAYENFVHIKGCLATGYIQTVWRQVKVTFIPVPGKVNYTQGKAYCAISLSFIQKTTQKLVTRNINDRTLWHVPYIYNNLPTKQGSPQKSQSIMWLHTYREQQKTWSYTPALLDIEEASDITPCDITKAACPWHGFGDTF